MATTKVSTKLLETVGVAEGGTGATSASAARTSLGLVIGTNVLAPNGSGSSLTGIAGGATDAEAANIMLNAFRISVNGGLSVQNMVDGVVDEFEDETGVDTSTSTNETYDATKDLYENPGPTTDTDGGFGTGSQAHVGVTVFARTWTVPNNSTVIKMSVHSGTSGSIALKIALENSSTDLDIVMTETFSHTGSGWEEFTLTTPYAVPASGTYRAGAYGANAWTVTSTSQSRAYYTGDATGTSETYSASSSPTGLVRVTSSTAAQNMTLFSNATTALAAPDDANIVIWQEDVDAITLNTDLKAYASRDGTSWTQMTLAEVANLTSLVATPTLTESATTEFTGDNADFTFTGSNLDSGSTDQALKGVDTFTGEVDIDFTLGAGGSATYGYIGFYDTTEDSTWTSNDNAGMTSMTNSFSLYNSNGTWQIRLGSTVKTSFANATNDVMKIERDSTNNIKVWQNSVLKYTYVSTFSGTLRMAIGSHNSLDWNGLTWTIPVVSSVATNILTGSVDISGQSSGTSMKYKIETLNTKEQKIHAVALQWS